MPGETNANESQDILEKPVWQTYYDLLNDFFGLVAKATFVGCLELIITITGRGLVSRISSSALSELRKQAIDEIYLSFPTIISKTDLDSLHKSLKSSAIEIDELKLILEQQQQQLKTAQETNSANGQIIEQLEDNIRELERQRDQFTKFTSNRNRESLRQRRQTQKTTQPLEEPAAVAAASEPRAEMRVSTSPATFFVVPRIDVDTSPSAATGVQAPTHRLS